MLVVPMTAMGQQTAVKLDHVVLRTGTALVD